MMEIPIYRNHANLEDPPVGQLDYSPMEDAIIVTFKNGITPRRFDMVFGMAIYDVIDINPYGEIVKARIRCWSCALPVRV